MQKGLPPEHEEALWTPLEHAWHLLATPDYLRLPLQLVLSFGSDCPQRKYEVEFDKVVKAMIKCLSSKLVYVRATETSLRGSFIYWYLVHNVAVSLSYSKRKEAISTTELTRRNVTNLLLKQTPVAFSEWEKKLLWSDLEKSVPSFVYCSFSELSLD